MIVGGLNVASNSLDVQKWTNTDDFAAGSIQKTLTVCPVGVYHQILQSAVELVTNSEIMVQLITALK